MNKWTPHPYQLRAAQHVLTHPGAALFLKPGLGKTSCTLAAIEVLKQHALGPTLVIAPLRVAYSVWRQEAAKWGSTLRFELLHGKDKGAAIARGADVYLINPEGLEWLAKQSRRFDVLVLDESTKFKNARTVRYKALETLHAHVKRVILLTGTPAANHIQDLWAQIKLLDGGARLGAYITHFRKAYLAPELIRISGGRTIEIWHPRPDTAERVHAQINDICLYMSDEDYLALPKLVVNKVVVDMPSGAWDVYTELKEDLFTEVRNNTISAANAAVKVQKLRQITGGAVYGDEGAEELHEAKIGALEELVAEAQGDPVLVAVAFQHEAQRLQRVFPDAPYLGGGISAARSDAIAAKWNAGEIPVLLAHPSSVAHGLNLQAGGNMVVWFSLTWSLEEYDQFIRRVYRQGQTRPVIVHYLIVPETIDELIYESLQAKDRTQRSLLDLLKENLRVTQTTRVA